MFVKVIKDSKGLGLNDIYQEQVLIGIMSLLSIDSVECFEIQPTKYKSYCRVHDKAITEISCVECQYWLYNDDRRDVCANRAIEYNTGKRFILYRDGRKEYEEEQK